MIPKLSWAFCFFLLLRSEILFGQDQPEYAVIRIDTSLLKNAEAVIRFEETRYIINSPRTYIRETSKVVTLFDENSSEAYVGEIYSKYSNAEIISVMLYDAFGNLLRKMKKSEVVDAAAPGGGSIFNDQRILVFKSTGGQLPFTLAYKTRVSYHETMYYPDWQPQGEKVAVEQANFILDAPESLVIHTKTLNHDFQFTTETLGGRKLQTWKLDHQKAWEQEASGPPWFELYPMVLLSPSIFQVEDYTGSMSDWKSFGAFLYEINKGKEKMPPEMAARIHQMTANSTTPFEKIDTLYHWLQKNMRYVSVQLGIGGWQSFDATYVEKNRFGDCKALSTFMKGMLSEVGIEAWQVVLKWDEEDNLFLEDFLNHDFNHMMLHIPGENMWLECTSNNLPTGEIDKDEENKTVLLITPDGGKVSKTPISPAASNQIYTLDTVFMADPLKLTGKEWYKGNMQRGIRSLYYNSSAEEQREYFLELFPLSITKLYGFKTYSALSGTESTMEYKATLSQFGSASGTRYFIPVNSMQPPHHTCPANTVRKTDYISKDNYTEINDIYLALPADYSIEYLPPASTLDFQGNHYSVEIKLENQFIHVHHQIVETPMRLTPDQYQELCTYYSAVIKSNSQMMVLKKSKT